MKAELEKSIFIKVGFSNSVASSKSHPHRLNRQEVLLCETS